MIEHVRINDVAPWIQHVGNGVATAFAFPFPIFLPADLEVWLDDSPQSAGYTVTGAGASGGGTVLFAAAPADNARVTLRRRLALARLSDFQADGIIRAKVLNDELDFQVAALQQVAHDLGRAVKRAPASASTADLTLPEPQAGAVLAWHDDGSGLTNKTFVPEANVTVVFGAAGRAVAEAGPAEQARSALGLGTAAVEDVAAFAQLDGQGRISEAVLPQAFEARLGFLERNLAINILRDQIDSGWSVLKMVNGVADEFEDDSGISVAAMAAVDVIPKMTGYNAPSGVVTTENDAGGAAWKMFDDTAGDGFVWSSAAMPNWVAYDFGASAKVLRGYSLKMAPSYGANGPKSWTFEGWDADAGAWVTLDTRVNQMQWVNNERRLYEFDGLTAFAKFRLAVSERHHSSSLVIEEMEFFERIGGDSCAMTYDATGDFYTNTQFGPGDIVPTMTAESQNGYVVSYSVGYSYNPNALFNDTPPTGDYWYTYGYSLPQWIKVQLPAAKRIRRVVLTAAASNQMYMPKDFQLQGSFDGTQWTTLLTVAGAVNWAGSERRQWSFINPDAYPQYRLYATATNSSTGYVLITDMELHEHLTPANGTLVSIPYSADETPGEARLVILHQPIDPVIPNQDLVAEISRDGGASWAACPLSSAGPFDAASVVLAGIADLGGQPGGTTMRWRIRTLGNKEQRLHGVWMQWR